MTVTRVTLIRPEAGSGGLDQGRSTRRKDGSRLLGFMSGLLLLRGRYTRSRRILRECYPFLCLTVVVFLGMSGCLSLEYRMGREGRGNEGVAMG
jgi:hypothetical protein